MLLAIHRLDLQLLGRIFSQGERRMVRPLARAFSRSGDGYLHLLVPLLLLLLATGNGHISRARAMAAALLRHCCLHQRRPPHPKGPSKRKCCWAIWPA